MPSNLSTIGFTFADEQAFVELMIRLAGASVGRLACECGDYAVWRSRTGAELWFHLPVFGSEDDALDIEGLTPFYEGQSEASVEIRARLRRADDNPFEGAFLAWVEDSFPVVFEAVDFAAHAARELPLRTRVRLDAFALELEAFADEAAFAAAERGGNGIPLAPRAFVPIGQLAAAAADDDDAVPTSSALLTGKVLEHRLLSNEASGGTFHWLLVDSLDAVLDVLADPEVVKGTITVGGTVEVSCRMFGRLLD